MAPSTVARNDDTAKLTIEEILSNPAARTDPYAVFDELRSQSPVHRTNTGVWVVTSHKAATQLLRDPRVSRWEAARTETYPDEQDDAEIQEIFAKDPELKTAIDATGLMLINRDEPDHTRLRKLVRHAFLPGAIAEWQARIDEATDAIIERTRHKKELEFIRDVAFPLPEIVICEMSGVPHKDHALWSQWSHDSVGAIRTPKPRGENLRRVQEAQRNFYHYFKALIAKRRGNIGDDLISILMKAEEEGQKLSEDEIVGTMVMLIQAGHETTANLIGTGMMILLTHPDLYRDLRENPERIPQAVEEFLRFDGPAQFSLPRVALEDIDCEGVTIAKGDRIIIIRHAVNRDPAIFSNPHHIDFDRPNIHEHQAFGSGPHVCLGRQLALLEARTMFRAIVQHLPDLELIEPPTYHGLATRGFKELRVRRRSLS